MVINQKETEFLGMHLKKGIYFHGPYIAKELQKFLEQNLNTKQVQLFLVIVNYVRDFVPKFFKALHLLQQMLKKDIPL